jgi:hypothetical protein
MYYNCLNLLNISIYILDYMIRVSAVIAANPNNNVHSLPSGDKLNFHSSPLQ